MKLQRALAGTTQSARERERLAHLRRCFAVLALAVSCAWPCAARAQHIHVNAGAINTTQNGQLYFANGPTFDAQSRYDVFLSFTNGGSFSNLYQGAGVSFTALASTSDNGGPAPGHAADGSFLQLQFVSVSGPTGAVFGVWTQEVGNPGVSHPVFALATGTTNGTNLIALSESDGSAGADPYGHIHGRTYTATRPGLYTLGCRILDTSRNGTTNGPIHIPSALYSFYFQAGLTISSWSNSPSPFTVTFGTTAGKTYYVESTPDPTTTNWTAFAGPFTGNNRLLTVTTNSTVPKLFFRVRSN